MTDSMHFFIVFTIFLGQSLTAVAVLATIYLPMSKVFLSYNTVIVGLEHQASLSLSNLSSNPCTAPTRNATLCTWHNWYRPFNTSNPFLLLPVSGKRMKGFLRFRLSCHSLPIETGGHDRPPTPKSSRLGPHCLASVGDEDHLVFDCLIFQPLRDKYHSLFSSPTSSMRAFFAQKNRMSVYKFISDCLDMINA